MEFIADVLGVDTIVKKWSGQDELPFYLNDAYDMREVTLDSTKCLFIKPKDWLGMIPSIRKHIAKIRETYHQQVVLELDAISAKQRKALVGARIPFVVNGTQIYMPFIGVYLQEKYPQQKLLRQRLIPTAQMLLFYCLYKNTPKLYTREVLKEFGLSAMQISRATKQLQYLGLVSVQKDGVQNVISCMGSRLEVFGKAIPHLIDPVRKKVYVDIEYLPNNLPLAGMSALAELSMMNAPKIQTFAFLGALSELIGTDTLIDSETQALVEIWHYSPTLFSTRPGVVDPLSLVASLQANEDERVRLAGEKLITDILGQRQ